MAGEGDWRGGGRSGVCVYLCVCVGGGGSVSEYPGDCKHLSSGGLLTPPCLQRGMEPCSAVAHRPHQLQLKTQSGTLCEEPDLDPKPGDGVPKVSPKGLIRPSDQLLMTQASY